jgi:DNA-binding LacI/PurR family transcriptional regulator
MGLLDASRYNTETSGSRGGSARAPDVCSGREASHPSRPLGMIRLVTKPAERGAATIIDVARVARVSTTTVSRTFREPLAVGEKTRARVLEAAAVLHYYPNQTAATLASSRSRLVGFLAPGIENPFYYDLYVALSSLVQKRGHEVLLQTNGYESRRLHESLRHMIGRRAAGVVLPGGSVPDPLLTEMQEMCIAMASVPQLEYDAGIECLLRYLGDLGHRSLGIVEHRTSLADERIAALHRALLRFPGFDFCRACAPDSLDGGRLGCREILAQHPEVTALLCTHDIMAVGALRELRDQGHRVPDDFSVVGIDNIALARFCAPTITTIDVPREPLAAALCASLFDKTATASIDCTLLVRESTGQVRSAR